MIRALHVADTMTSAERRRERAMKALMTAGLYGPSSRDDEALIRRGELFDVMATAGDVSSACFHALWWIDRERSQGPAPDVLPPLARAVVDDLRRDVELGELPRGGRVPSIRALASLYGVSPSTASKAVQHLTRCGVLRGESTRGYVVA